MKISDWTGQEVGDFQGSRVDDNLLIPAQISITGVVPGAPTAVAEHGRATRITAPSLDWHGRPIFFYEERGGHKESRRVLSEWAANPLRYFAR